MWVTQNNHGLLEDSVISVNKKLFQAKIVLYINSYNRAMHEQSLVVGYDYCSIYMLLNYGFALSVAAKCGEDNFVS